MLSLKDNIAHQAAYARTRVEAATQWGSFLASAALAGAFVGLGVIFMFTAAAPLKVAGNPFAPLVAGSVFGVGLILVVFSGVQLLTSAMMVIPIGWMRRTIPVGPAVWALILTYLGNFLGCVVLAAVVYFSGAFYAEGAVGQYLAMAVAKKASYSAVELVMLGALCNIFVCLAIWGAAATKNAMAKVAIIGWCIAAFVTSGFEHVVANMTTFSLALFAGVEQATWAELIRNQFYVGLGNFLGGALLVAVPLVLAAGRVQQQAPAELQH